LSAAGSLEHHEHPVGAHTRWPFGVEVGSDRGEEPGRDRDQPLVATLAVGDEHPPFRDPQVEHPQTEDLAAAQTTEHHRGDHCPVPVSAQRTGERVNLGRGEDPWQLAGPAGQRHSQPRTGSFTSCWQATRDRVGRDVAAGLQVAEEARDDRQSPGHRAGSNSAVLLGPVKRLHEAARGAASALGGDEPEPSAGRTSSGGLPTTPKNTFRS
jgi:hypothetical protein